MPRKKRGTNANVPSRGRPFAQGNKAAAGHGRPPVPAEYKAAMTLLEPEALQALGDIIRDPANPRRGPTAEYVINRLRGKPTERREISGPGGEPVEKQFGEILAAFTKLTGEK